VIARSVTVIRHGNERTLMTTISDTTAQTGPADRLLRVALKVDAIASGLTGLGFVGTPKMF
jgi:hypothetical protein